MQLLNQNLSLIKVITRKNLQFNHSNFVKNWVKEGLVMYI